MPPAGVDYDVRGELDLRTAGGVAHADHGWWPAVGGEQAMDLRARREPNAGAAQHVAAQHPLERGAPAAKCNQVVIAGLAFERRQGERWTLEHIELRRAGGEQRREQIRIPVAQQAAQAAEEGVRMAHLRSAFALPGRERL